MKSSLVLSLGFILLYAAVLGQLVDGAVVQTSVGSFVGREAKDIAYLGIKYGSACRFCAPKPFSYGNVIHNATAFGPMCIQKYNPDNHIDDMSEDCLSLNIWTPRGIRESSSDHTPLLPVHVHIHGGAFMGGSGALKVWNSTVFTQRNIIFVTFNYRLGIFGFWRHPELTKRQPTHPTNFGLLDQQLALQWIQDHINHFGGDKSRVTIGGDSAGGMSILNHLTSPVHIAKPLFQKALISSVLVLESPRITLNKTYIIGSIWADQAGCAEPGQVLQCMQDKNPYQLVRTNMFRSIPFESTEMISRMVFPIDDGVNFPNPIHSILEGKYDRACEIISGTAQDEASLFSWFAFPVTGPTPELLRHFIEVGFAEHDTKVLEMYHPDRMGSPFHSFSTILTDLRFHCPLRKVLRAINKYSSMPIRQYVFNYTPQDIMLRGVLMAYHCIDHVFLHHNPLGTYVHPSVFTDEEWELAKQHSESIIQIMSDNYVEVEKFWPAWTPNGNEPFLMFGNGTHTSTSLNTSYKKDICDFWDAAYPTGPTPLEYDLFYFEHHHALFLNEAFIWLLDYRFQITRVVYVISSCALGYMIYVTTNKCKKQTQTK